MPIGDWALRSDEQSLRATMARSDIRMRGYEALGQGIQNAAQSGVHAFMQAKQMEHQRQQDELKNQLEIASYEDDRAELEWKMQVAAQQQQLRAADQALRQNEFQFNREVQKWRESEAGQNRISEHARFSMEYQPVMRDKDGNPYQWVPNAAGQYEKETLTEDQAKQKLEEWAGGRRGSSTREMLPQREVEGIHAMQREKTILEQALNSIDTDPGDLPWIRSRITDLQEALAEQTSYRPPSRPRPDIQALRAKLKEQGLTDEEIEQYIREKVR